MWASKDSRAEMLFALTTDTHDSTLLSSEGDCPLGRPENHHHHSCEISTPFPDTEDEDIHQHHYPLPSHICLRHQDPYHHHYRQYHPHHHHHHQEMEEDSGSPLHPDDLHIGGDDSHPFGLSFPFHFHEHQTHLYPPQPHDHLHHQQTSCSSSSSSSSSLSSSSQYHQHPHQHSYFHQHHHNQQQNQTHPHPHHHHPPSSTTRTISRRPSNFKLSNSVWTICVTILLSLIFLSSHIGSGNGVSALSCASCDLQLCPDTSGCPGGLVTDICGCCQVCAKIENQSCGGPFGIRGKCDRNLQCFIRPEPGKRITGSEEGICREVKEFRCEGINCPQVFEQLLCPRDSNLVTFASDTSRVIDNAVRRRTATPLHLPNQQRSSTTPQNNGTLLPLIISPSPSTSSTTNNKTSGVNNAITNNEIENNESYNHLDSNTNDNNDDNDNNNNIDNEDSPVSLRTSEKATSSPTSTMPIVEPEGESDADDFYNKAEVAPETMSYCVCNTSRCLTPVCAPGFTAFVSRNATGFPGSCCDTYTCNKTKGCDPVICPALDETPCTDDSIRLPNIWTEDNCCELQQRCSCPSSDRCEPVKCPSGFQVQIIARATGIPGACCDKFRCVNESGLTCRYDGKEMKNGEKWDIDKCRSCVCKDGLNRCRDKTCSSLSCLWIVIPEDECCPICRGCVSDSGNFYNNSDVWKENDCTTCKCVEGHVQCQAESCVVYCANPVQVPGQCCPVCPDEENTTPSTALTPLACPSLDTCNLECPAGLELSPHGCFMCKCKKEKCTLDCPYGLKKDFEGNIVCECQSPEIRCPPWEEDQCDKKCEYGYRRNRDGCIKCKCNRCPPLNCTKRCLHGLLVNDEGCRICRCKEEAIPELIGRPRVEGNSAVSKAKDWDEDDKGDYSCLSLYGVYRENGESWNDGCRVCYCHKGVEMCSLIACRAPLCSNPVFKLGDCCPTCPGLTIPSPNGDKLLCQSTSGDYYVEGETWKMDACTRCVCHGGSILCENQACPPVLCHHPVKPENQCCPICKGEDLSLLPPTPLRRRCKSPTGMLYKHREVWRSSPCQTCVCQDGQFHCYNQMCAPVNCNKTLLRKDQCCPACAEPETEKPKICSYNNEYYDSDEKWEGDNCTQCLCSNGRVHCFPLSCPTLKCSVMVKKRGQCCPTCYEMPVHEKESREKYFNTTASSVKEDGESLNYVGMIILGIILLGFACIIVYLVYRLYLRRQKHNFRETCAASNDELQGQTFLPPSETKTNMDIVDIKQPALEKLYYSSLGDKGTEERAFNTYTDLTFCDQNKNSAPIFKNC